MIKGADEVGRNYRGDDLISMIKYYRGNKGNDLETVGREDSAPPDPPDPPRRSQITVEQEDLETVGQ